MTAAHAADFTSVPAASTRSITSLVLGILGVAFCPLFGPVAWYLAHQELDDIARFYAPREGQGFARAGQILGIIGSLPLLLIAAVLVLCIPVALFALLAS
jgi:hypothetical protein